MNSISEQLLEAMDTIVDQKVSELQFDKTIQATIHSIVNLDSGEYKVRYSGNIFSAFSSDLTTTYKIDDLVYVVVPEGNFSAKKMITSLVSSQSLSYNQLAALQNAIFEISPEFNALYGGLIYDPEAEYGVIAGRPAGQTGSYKYIYQGPTRFQSSGYHGLFQQYANNYELIRIQANFNTRFYDVHSEGNYGLEVEFYAKGDDVVSYRLDLNAFNGDPYCLNIYSPQSVIIKVQKNYLLGLKSIKLFEEDFAYDRLLENGLVTDKYNTTDANIFVKDICIQYVEQKDLTDTSYYLMISAPKGIAFTSNISSLDLVGRLVYEGKDIMDDSKCDCQWFVRDLTVMIGDERYNKEAGFGWAPLPQTSSRLSLVTADVLCEQRYKLLVTYNDTVSLSAEIEIFNHNAKYSYHMEQHTNDADITLQLVNDLENGDLVGDWFLSYPDGSYIELTKEKKKNSILVSPYLKYSSVVFYCQIYDLSKTNIIGTLEHTIYISESEEDVTISYVGEDTFRYDANGDIAVEDSEKERTLQVNLTWKEGFGTAYTVQWLMRDEEGKESPIPTQKSDGPPMSMIDSFWVDNSNILHYNIKQKYKVDFNNNTLVVKITTITEEEYRFNKEILFVKDGDQGTNGTTYVLAVRPCNSSGLKLSGLQPLIYNGGWNNTLPLRCYVYKDGEMINGNSKYAINYKWEGVNITFSEASPADRVTARGVGSPGPSSTSVNLQFYVKVQVDINDKMNGRKTSIYASYPIDVAVGGIDISLINIDSIPSYIKYTASGITPKFYSNGIKFLYGTRDYTSSIVSMNTNILDFETKDGQRYLKPASSFIAENVKNTTQSNIGVLKCQYTTTQFLVHPVIMYLDVYGNEAINGWDGEALKIDDNGQYIFAPQIGAGEKDSQNRFSGVVMGKDSTQDKTGLYGYQYGVNTFGLMENGIAYFGAKSGGGQIVIDGTTAEIYGGGQYPAGSGRSEVGGDSANGMSIYLANLNPSRPENQYAIKIAKGIFNVMYDGSLTATSADITGIIEAKEGYIGCSGRHTKDGWHIETNRISSGTGGNTVALDSSENSYFRIWAGASSAGSAYNPSASMDSRITSPAKFVVTKDGFVYMRECFVKGRIEAEEGLIGGWNILKNRLVSDGKKVGLASSGTYRIWANADDTGGINDTPTFTGSSYFYVKSNGEMSCRNAEVRGTIYSEKGEIGGWTISSSGLSNGDNIYIRSNGSMKVGNNFSVSTSGILSVKDADVEGRITAEKGRIGQWTIDANGISGNGTISGGSISGSSISGGSITGSSVSGGSLSGSTISGGSITIGSGFSVNSSGQLTATDANITGTINATVMSAYQITIKALSGTSFGSSYGYLGMVAGSTGTDSTYNLGIQSQSSASIILQSSRNIRLTASGDLYLQASGKVEFKGNSIDLSNISASNQTGIYARFA